MSFESQNFKMKIDIISFTQNGTKIAVLLQTKLDNATAYTVPSVADRYSISSVDSSIREWTAERFLQGNGLIFVGSMGIAVRCIAPYIESKSTDPAVVVVDEKGRYVISVLSGHIGGANQLAQTVADLIGAVPVITTATDLNKVFSVDSWAKKSGYYIVNPEKIKNISAKLLKGNEVGLYSEFPIRSSLPKGVVLDNLLDDGIVVSLKPKSIFKNTLMLIPKSYVLGVGCRKNMSSRLFEQTVMDSLEENAIPIELVMTIASIDVKSKEKAILDFACKYGLRTEFFTAEQLKLAEGSFDHSNFVEKTVGVGNVCERACSIVGRRMVVQKQMLGGITLAASMVDWSVKFDN